MIINYIKKRYAISKIKEAEWRSFESEDEAISYAQFLLDTFRDELKNVDIRVNTTKSKAIYTSGPNIGKWVTVWYFEFLI